MPSGQVPEGIRNYFREMVHYINTVHGEDRIQRITHTDYGQFATINNNKNIAFSEDLFLGEELGPEGLPALPEKIQTFIKQYFAEVSYKYITIDPLANNSWGYKYRISLDKGYKAWFDTSGNWKYITSLSNETDHSLPLDLINIVPEKIRGEVGRITKLVTIYKRSETSYDIGISRTDIKTYTTEVTPPTDLHQKEIKEFIDTYFGTISGHSITVPLQEQDVYYLVKLPNGFDFRLDEALEWDLIDGHGYPFGEKQKQLIPKAILQYIANNVKSDAQSDITTAKREYDSYKLIFTNGTLLQFNLDGTFEGEHTNTSTAYEKAYNYIRYTYPKDYGVICRSWEGLIFLLSDGTKIQFDKEGNLIK